MTRLRWTWILLGAVAIVVAISIVFTLTRGRPLAPRESERRAVLQDVGPAPPVAPPPANGAWIAGNCVIEPSGDERVVTGTAAGRIASIAVDEGEEVRAGDVIVRLSDETERAAARAAEAEVEQARAELSRLEAGTRPEEIETARAQARAARAQAELSQGVFERLERAYEGGGATEDELERARLQARADREAAEAAQASLRQARRGPLEQEIDEARAALSAAEARRDQADALLRERAIEAPIRGEVLEVARGPGEFTQPGETLVILGDTRRLQARMEIDERDASAVKAGAEARVSVPGETRDARVVEVGQRVRPKEILTDDPAARTDVRVLELVLAIDQPVDLIVGQRGVCYAEAAERPHVPAPPGEAYFRRAPGDPVGVSAPADRGAARARP